MNFGFFYNISGIHHNHSLSQSCDHAKVMSNPDNCHADLFFESPDQVHNLSLNRHIECGCGLIGNEQLRIAGDPMAIITRWRMPPEYW